MGDKGKRDKGKQTLKEKRQQKRDDKTSRLEI